MGTIAAVGGLILRVVVGLLVATCRVRSADPDVEEGLVESGDPVVFAVWHHEILMLAMTFPRALIRRGLPVSVLISRSEDGDLGHRVAELLGATVVRGSSSRGGTMALRRLRREIVDRGSSPILIPDGPRGPAREPKGGTMAVARLTGVPVIPVGLAASSSWRLGSWDRTVVPKPFARIGFALGPALDASEVGVEGGDDRLGESLDRAEARARACADVRG